MLIARIGKKGFAVFAALTLAVWFLLGAAQAHADAAEHAGLETTAGQQSSVDGNPADPDHPRQDEAQTREAEGNTEDNAPASAIPGNNETEQSENAAEPSAEPQSASFRASAEQVASGQAFTIAYGVAGIKDNVYAQDVMIEYDPAALEFVPDSLKVLKEGITVVHEPITQSPGKLRVILASMGGQHPVTGTENIFELGFKAANVDQDTESTLRMSRATLSNELGNEFSLGSVSVTVKIKAVGSEPGDLNGDGKVSIGDLAMIAAQYGLNSSSPQWNGAKHMDLDGSGAIDIADLSIVAKKIVGQP